MTRGKSAMSRLDEALNETAMGMLRIGLIDQTRYDQITLRHLPDDQRAIEMPVPSADDIKALREKANLIQAMFARTLNLSTSYVSQLERGVRRPSGPALVLLELIRKRGIEAIQ